MKLFLFATLVLTGCSTGPKHSETAPASAAQFRYNELMIKDYDEMLQLVNLKLKQARGVGSNTSDENVNDKEAVEHLREAAQLILSRPDSDNMVAKLMPDVRKELIGYNAFEDVLSGIAAGATATLKDENSPGSRQATAVFVLENLLAQVRPEVASNGDIRRIVQRINDAKIEIGNPVRNDMKLRGMFKTHNPSKLAATILKENPTAAKK